MFFFELFLLVFLYFCTVYILLRETIKMSKKKLTVKPINEKCKALKEIEKGLSKKEEDIQDDDLTKPLSKLPYKY